MLYGKRNKKKKKKRGAFLYSRLIRKLTHDGMRSNDKLQREEHESQFFHTPLNRL